MIDSSYDERILRSHAARASSSACRVVEQGGRVLKMVEGICLVDGFVMTNSYSKVEGDGENSGAWKAFSYNRILELWKILSLP